jgi:C-terminal processing protease CtpA/Prc
MMMPVRYLTYFSILFLLFGCRTFRSSYDPNRAYSAEQLKQDFELTEKVLEKTHPSLYWHITPDSLAKVIQSCKQRIQDSMTADQFQWQVMAPFLHEIRCGHTTVGRSRKATRWLKKYPAPYLPLQVKNWKDTLVVVAAERRSDSLFRRGLQLIAIDGISAPEIIHRMHQVLSLDGYASTVNEARISSNFAGLHRQLFGIREKYGITYLDSNGLVKTDSIKLYRPGKKDSGSVASKKQSATKSVKPKKKTPKLERYRSLSIDSSNQWAIMRLNSFQKGHLRHFFKQSFKALHERNIPNLILDLRANGGGYVQLSTKLTRYISRKPCRVADSAYAITRNTRTFRRYFNGWITQDIGLRIMSGAKRGNHFPAYAFERKWHKPYSKLHYNGHVYVLTAGQTFSASTLFANAIKGQQGITIVGEETGGGHYGNSGIIIPTFTLPHTQLRVRYPLYRLVQFNHQENTKGKGIQPDWEIPPQMDAIKKGIDLKMKLVKDRIQGKS